MKNVLVINSSAKAIGSHSRRLTEVFVSHWRNSQINPIIRFRELGNATVPHVNQNWITAAFKAEETRSEEEKGALRTSDAYIAELKTADIIVLGTPMYNWSIPSSLKAYIDQIVRVNETFKIDTVNIRQPYVGLLKDKTLLLLLSRGDHAYDQGEYNAHLDFQSAYLRTVFNILGISNVHVIALNGTSLDKAKFNRAIEISHQSIRDLIQTELVSGLK